MGILSNKCPYCWDNHKYHGDCGGAERALEAERLKSKNLEVKLAALKQKLENTNLDCIERDMK